MSRSDENHSLFYYLLQYIYIPPFLFGAQDGVAVVFHSNPDLLTSVTASNAFRPSSHILLILLFSKLREAYMGLWSPVQVLITFILQ